MFLPVPRIKLLFVLLIFVFKMDKNNSMKKIFSLVFILFLALSSFNVFAQSHYDPHEAFAPLFYPHNANKIRSPNGAPGPEYWQNRADYKVDVKFDTTTKVISGKVQITYTNNSPDNLSNLWLQLVQNIDAPSPPLSSASRRRDERGAGAEAGFHIHSIQIINKNKSENVPYLIDGTRMQIQLPEKLKGNGEQLQLQIQYDYTLQQSSAGGRSGYMDTQNGRLFEVSYWYPRMCVYDDLKGWNTLPFLGAGEFYLDYGNIDYSITLPAGMIIAGCGILDNPEKVLTDKEINQLEKAKQSDKTIMIRGKEDLTVPATRSSSNNFLTWHFHMNNTRDVAWAASEAFLWDAARINSGEKQALAMSFYPVESASDSMHGRGTEYLKASVELFSKKWFPYPYPVAINVAGKVGGMEFPGLAMDWWKAKNKSLFALISHEIGHSWYPMIVGSNERRFAWMDEGFNTFIDLLAQAEFNKGEYAPKRDGEYAPHGGNPAEEIVPYITQKNIPPIMTPADGMEGKYIHPLEYFKTAFGLVLLRNVILGHKRFDYAFQQYTADWAYKHPSPWDFFREIENKAGADLDWFWRGWFLNNWKLDQAVKGVKYIDNDPSKGAMITIKNLKQMPMPVIVKITGSNGKVQTIKLPVQIWESSGTATFKIATTHAIKSVVLDPEKQLPDVDRRNNKWEQ